MVQPHVPRLWLDSGGNSQICSVPSRQEVRVPLPPARQSNPPPTAQVILYDPLPLHFTAPPLFFPKAQGDPGQTTTNSSADSPGRISLPPPKQAFSQSLFGLHHMSPRAAGESQREVEDNSQKVQIQIDGL